MNRWHISTAARILRKGGVISYPTEAVFGLGCLPECSEAVYRILRIKKRSVEKGLILVAATPEQLDRYVTYTDATIRGRVLSTWPGPVTWLLPATPEVPDWIKGCHASVAVRVSAHPVVTALCSKVGALVSTSANPEGLPPARTLREVERYFDDTLDYIVPGRVGGLSAPTEIRDACSGAILRSGSRPVG